MAENATLTLAKQRQRSSFLWLWLLLALFLVMSAASLLLLSRQLRGVSSSSLPDYGEVPDFQLTERSGAMLSRADLLGSVWVADFIFTRCQGSCPVLSARMAALQQQMPPSTTRPIRLVSFSVDPEWDTPERLRAYAARYQADAQQWLFLTGPYRTLADLIVTGFHLGLSKAEDTAMTPHSEPIVHSDRFVLVDAIGHIRGYYQPTTQDGFNHLLQDLRVLHRD